MELVENVEDERANVEVKEDSLVEKVLSIVVRCVDEVLVESDADVEVLTAIDVLVVKSSPKRIEKFPFTASEHRSSVFSEAGNWRAVKTGFPGFSGGSCQINERVLKFVTE